MKKEYFCDYFCVSGKSGELELDIAKVVHTQSIHNPETISVRLLLSKVTPYIKKKLMELSERRVEVLWVPHDKEYMAELVGDLHHIKTGENSYSFRVTENSVPNEKEEKENLELLNKCFPLRS